MPPRPGCAILIDELDDVALNGLASGSDTGAKDLVHTAEMIDLDGTDSDTFFWPLDLKEILSLIEHVRNHRSVFRGSLRRLPAWLSFFLCHFYRM